MARHIYPTENSERVTSGDKIGFTVRIKSSYATDKRFEYKLSIVNPQTGAVVSSVANDKITVPSTL